MQTVSRSSRTASAHRCIFLSTLFSCIVMDSYMTSRAFIKWSCLKGWRSERLIYWTWRKLLLLHSDGSGHAAIGVGFK